MKPASVRTFGLLLLSLAACSSKKQPPPGQAMPPVSAVQADAATAQVPPVAPVAPSKEQGSATGTEAFPAQPTLDAATQALIPADGIMFATRTMRDSDDVLLLYQLTPTGLREVFHQAATQVSAMGWLDRHTLVLYSEDAATGDGTVQRIVDGKPQAAVVVPWAAWKIPLSAGAGELHLYSTSEIWLKRCARRVTDNDFDSQCLTIATLRVDRPPPFVVDSELPTTAELTRRVVDMQNTWFHFDTSDVPTVAAPLGHKLAIFKVKGAKRKNFITTYDQGWRCRRPAMRAPGGDGVDDSTNSEWPYGSDWIERGNIPNFQPNSVRWVSVLPARYLIEGTATNMLGKKSPVEAVFRACGSEPLAAAAYLGHDIWAEMTEGLPPSGDLSNGMPQVIHGEWNLFIGPTKIGTGFGGTPIAVQPAL